MKLQNHFDEMVTAFGYITNEMLSKIIETAKNDSRVKNLHTRVVWDCFWYLSDTKKINIYDWRKEHDFNDNHLDTLISSAFKKVFPDTVL